MENYETETVGSNILHNSIPEQNYNVHDSIKKLRKFSKFFSNVSRLEVADTVSIETQLELVRALREVE